MTRALEKGTLPDAAVSPKQRLFRGLVLGLGRFPPGRKAPQFVVPAGKHPEHALVTARKSLPALDLAIATCAERFGPNAALLPHAVLGPLTAAEWLRFHQVHTLHHMKQIAKLRACAAKANVAKTAKTKANATKPATPSA